MVNSAVIDWASGFRLRVVQVRNLKPATYLEILIEGYLLHDLV